MRSPRRWQKLLGRCILTAGLAGNGGCLAFLHPVAAPPAPVQQTCRSLPRCCRSHVYVFLINGVDPLHCGNLTGVRDYVQDLGFHKTYYGELHHLLWFKSEIRRIHQDDPQARFVLIGYCLGGKAVQCLAHETANDGLFIDLVVFLDAPAVSCEARHRPANVGRVLSIRSSGLVGGRTLEGAENLYLTDAKHWSAPTHEQTLATLAAALLEVASAVPVVEPLVLPPADREEPTPRPVTEPPATTPEEWHFLKPVSRLPVPKSLNRDPRPDPPMPGEKTNGL
jgi:hypothetical protein